MNQCLNRLHWSGGKSKGIGWLCGERTLLKAFPPNGITIKTDGRIR
jgi:hypothetical protein